VTDIERLTREYREARARYLAAKAETCTAVGYWSKSGIPMGKLTHEYEAAAIELADAIAGPA